MGWTGGFSLAHSPQPGHRVQLEVQLGHPHITCTSFPSVGSQLLTPRQRLSFEVGVSVKETKDDFVDTRVRMAYPASQSHALLWIQRKGRVWLSPWVYIVHKTEHCSISQETHKHPTSPDPFVREGEIIRIPESPGL